MRLANALLFWVVAISTAMLSSCKAIARSFASRAVAEDSCYSWRRCECFGILSDRRFAWFRNRCRMIPGTYQRQKGNGNPKLARAMAALGWLSQFVKLRAVYGHLCQSTLPATLLAAAFAIRHLMCSGSRPLVVNSTPWPGQPCGYSDWLS